MNYKAKRRSNSKRVVIALIVLCLCIYLAWPMAWPFSSSFCVERMRYLSDDEYIQMALLDESHTGLMDINNTDKPLSTFRERNPDCCSVDRSASDAGFLYFYYVEVRLFYEVAPEWKQRIGKYYQSYRRMSACGEPIRNYGSGTNLR